MALSFYFVNLQDSHIQTDLTIARDKSVGVLVGILAMGFIFDRFGTKSDAEQLQKPLVRNVRMLAQLGVCPVVAPGKGIASRRSAVSRGRINDSANCGIAMDAVRFRVSLSPSAREDVPECDRIQRAQPALRSIYLLELSTSLASCATRNRLRTDSAPESGPRPFSKRI